MRIEQFISGEAIDRLGDVVLLVGLDGSILDANPAALDCYGYSHAAMLTLNIRDIRALRDQVDIASQMREAAEDGAIFEAEHRRSDGTVFPVEVRSASVSVGGESALFSIVRDITNHRRIEQESRESESRYRALVERSPSAIFVNRDGKVYLTNAACIKLFGASSPEELIGKPALDLFDPESRPLVEARLRVDSETVPRVEVRIVRLDGTPVDVEAAASPLLEQGVSSIEVVLHDLTERKQAERKLRESESRSLIEASLDPLVTISPDGKITDVNKATEEATGVPRDRLIGTDFTDYFTEPDMARAGYERALKDGFVRDYPLRLQSASGSLMDVEYNATVYRNEAGEVQGVFAAARDVTEWKKAHEEVTRLAAVVTSSEEAIFTKSLDGIVTSWNAGAEAQYGYSAAEMIGESTTLLMPPGREDEPRQLIQRMLRGDRISGFETQRRRKDGSLLEVSLTLSPIRDDAGDIVAISVIGRDITALKRAEDERTARLRFVECMDEVDRAIQGTDDLDQMMRDVLGVALSSLECDRAWLFYPGDPDSPSFRVPMEVTRPEYPGAGILNEDVPLPPDMAENLREALESAGPLTYLAGSDRPVNKVTAEQFGVQSQMMVALHPKSDKPWVFGVHQCSSPRVWTSEERGLFQEIARRLTDALSSMLSQRDLRRSEVKFAAAFHASPDLLAITRLSDGEIVEVNEGYERMLGYTRAECVGRTTADLSIWADPADRAEFVRRLTETGWVTDFETTLRRKDGTLVPVVDFARSFDLRGEKNILSVAHDITKRKQAEEQSRIFMQAIQGAFDSCLLTDMNGNVTYANESAIRAFGYSPEEIVTFNVARFNARPEDAANIVKEINAKGSWNGELTCVRNNGEPFPASLSTSLLRDDRGNPTGMLGVFRDITESKRAEDALRESEEHFRLIAETITEAFWMADVALGRMYYISPAYERIWGRSLQSLYEDPQSFVEAIHPDDVARVLAGLELQETGQPFDHEYRIRRPDGTLRWIWDRGFPIHEPTGEVLRYVGIAQDITKRKQAEQALEFRNAILSTEQETSTDGILVVDEDARILSYNHRFAEMWHIPEGLVEGADDEPVLQFVADQLADQPAFLERVRHLYDHREETSRDELVLADGRFFDRYSAPMTGPGERYYGRVWYFRDVTERKRAEDVIRRDEADLREAQRIGLFGSFDWDARNDTIVWSDEYYRIYGLDPQQPPPGYEEHLKTYSPESAARLDAAVKNSMQTGEPYVLDLEQVREDGTRKWVTARAEATRDADGTITGLRGTAQDITERKTAEENIRKLNRVYAVLSGINEAIVHLHEPQALFEEACRVTVEDGGFIAAWIGLVDPADNRVRVVAQAGATKGYLDNIEVIVGHETLGRGPTGLSISERRHVFSQDIEHDPAMAPWRDNALRHGYRSSASFPLIVGDEVVGGFTIYADVPGFFTEEQLKLLDELAADISLAMEAADREERRRRAEEGLLESEDRFRHFFDRSVVPMSMTPPTGAAHVNEAFCEMLGYTNEELADEANWTQLTYPDDVADTQRQMDRLLAGESASARYEKRFVRKDGGIVWTDVSSSLRHDAEGQPLYFMTTFLDITRRKSDEVELEHRGAQLAASFSSLIEVICQVVEMRDPYTAGHQRRVSELAVRISEEMGMPAEQVEEIRVAALIHDVGKISVPAEILTKPGKLSRAEFELIKDHAEAGYRIIESANMEGSNAETVRQHHERCDGSGYPRGLTAEQLLPNAKVLMVADVVEAMTSHRPYRAALGMDAALEEIERGAGGLYDSEVCEACVTVCRHGGFVFSG